MKMRSTLTLALVAVSVLAQRAAPPQLQIRILPNKSTYSLTEKVIIKSELTNVSAKTLCFPAPDQNCETTNTGWIVTTGERINPANSEERDRFICHADGGGEIGENLDSQIRERWIKLPPGGVYVTNAAEAKARLNEVGDWKLTASYHPPVGAFNPKYTTTLQTAARKASCELPSAVQAEPEIVTVQNK
jgi:hypothetical protein